MINVNRSIFILIYLIIPNLYAQNNLDFEQWMNGGSYFEPVSWLTLNKLTGIGANVSCNKLSISHGDGSYSAQLNAVQIQDIDTIPGFMIQKSAIKKRINSVNFFYKYTGNAQDSAFIQVLFYKGSVTTSNVIGEYIILVDNQTSWHEAKQDVLWKSMDTPDSMSILIHTSRKNLNDTFCIDDITLSEFSVDVNYLTSGEGEPSVSLTLDGKVVLNNFQSFHTYTLKIHTTSGRLIEEAVIQDPTCIDFSYLNNGLYLYSITDPSGKCHTGKFVKY